MMFEGGAVLCSHFTSAVCSAMHTNTFTTRRKIAQPHARALSYFCVCCRPINSSRQSTPFEVYVLLGRPAGISRRKKATCQHRRFSYIFRTCNHTTYMLMHCKAKQKQKQCCRHTYMLKKYAKCFGEPAHGAFDKLSSPSWRNRHCNSCSLRPRWTHVPRLPWAGLPPGDTTQQAVAGRGVGVVLI